MFDGFFRDFSNIGDILMSALMRVIPALICITFHELAHGYTAYKLGDMTAKDKGRLTLNPVKHIDIFGLLMMLFFRFGWAKPVPVDMRNFKHPKWYMAVTAIAGPASNIVLAAFVLFIYGLLIVPIMTSNAGAVVSELIMNTVYLSLALAVFNLMPIPPLDGSKVLFSLLSEEKYFKLMKYERYGIIALILVLNTGIFRNTIGRMTDSLLSGLSVFFRAAVSLVI